MNARLNPVNRILLSIGHGGMNGETYDPGAINSATGEKENEIAKIITEKLNYYLTRNDIQTLLIPDNGLARSIKYVNEIGDAHTDWALEIHKDSTDHYNATTMIKSMGIYYHPTSSGSK